MQAEKTYIKFIDLTQLFNWSVQGLLDSKFSYSKDFELAKIGDFLINSRKVVNIKDEETYNRVTVRINNNGVLLRDKEKGINIGTKKQYLVSAGQFIVSKIDARNGAFGIIPTELDGAIVTNDFPLFNINTKRILPQFLLLVTTTKLFIKFAQSCSSGTTNRQRMDIDLFLEQRIPLPSIREQEIILKEYNAKINKAAFLKLQADNIEIEIEKYFLEQLGLPHLELKQKSKGLLIVQFHELERWDFFSTDIRIAHALLKSKYPIKSIGSTYKIAKRAWNKNNEKAKTFRYVEIGAIDPIKGIMGTKEVLVSKAPSRATQTIKENDLIVGTTRPYLKKFAMVDRGHHNNICSSGFTVFEPSKDYHLPFLMQFLKCSHGVEQLKNKMTGGLYPAITEGGLKEVRLPFPEVATQQLIMEKVKEKEKSIIASKIEADKVLANAQTEFEKKIFDHYED